MPTLALQDAHEQAHHRLVLRAPREHPKGRLLGLRQPPQVICRVRPQALRVQVRSGPGSAGGEGRDETQDRGIPALRVEALGEIEALLQVNRTLVRDAAALEALAGVMALGASSSEKSRSRSRSMDGAAAAATGMVSSVALRTGSSGAGREGTPSLLGSPPGWYSGLLGSMLRPISQMRAQSAPSPPVSLYA